MKSWEIVFSGHMAYKNCMKVEDVVESGPGLAFIAYPEAIGLLPVPQLFSLLFFIMLVLLGIDSQFAMVDVLVASTLGIYQILPFSLVPKKGYTPQNGLKLFFQSFNCRF